MIDILGLGGYCEWMFDPACEGGAAGAGIAGVDRAGAMHADGGAPGAGVEGGGTMGRGAGVRRQRRAAATELGDRIAEQAFHLDAAMHRLLTDVRAFDEAGYWADEGAVSCAAWLSWRVGWTPGTGREHVRVARTLGTLPLIDAALASGRLSYSKVRALTRVATAATEAELLNDALHTTAAQLEIVCRRLGVVQRAASTSSDELRTRRVVTRRTREDGMVVLQAVLPPDEAAIVYAAIEHEAARLARTPTVDAPPVEQPRGDRNENAHENKNENESGRGSESKSENARVRDVSAETGSCATGAARFDRADGLIAMSQVALRGDAPARSPVEVVLTIRRDALAATPATASGSEGAARGPRARGAAIGTFADGTCVSAETARRLACDCGVVDVEEDPVGTPLSVGRRTRTIPAAIARALALRDPVCRFPGCTNRHFLDGHHLEHWIDGGVTSLTNLARLCGHHHRFVHEHGYRIEWHGDELVFLDRHGRPVEAEPRRHTQAPLGWSTLRASAAAAGLTIDARTGQCRWDGRAPQYDWIVDRLAYAQLRRRTVAVPTA